MVERRRVLQRISARKQSSLTDQWGFDPISWGEEISDVTQLLEHSFWPWPKRKPFCGWADATQCSTSKTSSLPANQAILGKGFWDPSMFPLLNVFEGGSESSYALATSPDGWVSFCLFSFKVLSPGFKSFIPTVWIILMFAQCYECWQGWWRLRKKKEANHTKKESCYETAYTQVGFQKSWARIYICTQ